MKFPKELSKQRLTLLSKEDRELYEYEHSPFYQANENSDIENSDIENAEDVSDVVPETPTVISDEEMKNIMDEEILNIMEDELLPELNEIIMESLTEEECKKFMELLHENKDGLLEMINQQMQSWENMSLDEAAEGLDCMAWLTGIGAGASGAGGAVGWIGKLAGIGLAMTLGPLVMAFIAGKRMVAIKLLKRYMNKLVELTDDGVYKERSFMDTLKTLFHKRNRNTRSLAGDQSRGCFRSMQEVAERTICANTLVAGKACGFLAGDGIADAVNGSENGGLRYFYQNIASPLNDALQIV